MENKFQTKRQNIKDAEDQLNGWSELPVLFFVLPIKHERVHL